MKCVYCGSVNIKVENSVTDGERIYRKKKCHECGSKFFTQETAYVVNSVKGDRIKTTYNTLKRMQKEGAL